MKLKYNNDRYAKFWIFLGMFLWLMAALSKVESLTIYSIQLAFSSIISVLGVVSGTASLYLKEWGYKIMKFLSYLMCAMFVGSGIVVILLTLPDLIYGDYEPIIATIPIVLIVAAIGYPFYFIAENIEINNVRI